jgi:hypothetical protein
MAEIFVVDDHKDFAAVQKYIQDMEGPARVAVSKATEADSMHRLYRHWGRDISKDQGKPVDHVYGYFKREHIVPLWIEERATKAQQKLGEMFDEYQSTGGPVFLMSEVINSTECTPDQWRIVLTEMERFCASHRIPLSNREDADRLLR